LNDDGRRRLIQVFGMLVVYAACLFIPAGTLRWPNAWAYLLLFVGTILTVGLYVAHKNPDIVNERGRASENTKPFDKTFARVTIPVALSTYIVAGLDFRFGWSQVPVWLQLAGFIGLMPGTLMPYWVMLVNAYAATTVRVEIERGQHVISDGPYRFVRHPMYSGVVLSSVFLPLALGSWWVYLPSLLLAALFAWRTAREDRTLHEELPGYAEYATQTPYRLIPGIW
jgi:protein-S-isoprenylcysteine O-methyltransferase Ste14